MNAIVNALYGTHDTDLCYGYNAFWTRCLQYMRVDCGFEVARNAGWRESGALT